MCAPVGSLEDYLRERTPEQRAVCERVIAHLEDMGDVGTLALDISIATTPACPAELLVNNGCTFTHEYDLVWVRAE